MAIQRYRYRMTGSTVDLNDLASKSGNTLAAVGQSQGQIIDFDIDTTQVADLDDALARLGYVRIAGPGVVGTPGDAAEFVRRSGDTMDSGANITFQGGGKVTGLPLTPTGDTDAASKHYVDAMVVSGRIWREALLIPQQLVNGASGGISQAILGRFASAIAVGNFIVISDGTTVETFTAVAAAPGAFQFVGGVSAAADQAAFLASVNTYSTLWRGLATSGLDTYFAGAPTSQFVLYRLVPVATTVPDRVYGTLTSASAVRIVEFATGLQDYTNAAGTESNLPAADPTAKRFGFGRLEADLITVETHFVVEDTTQWTWDDDDQTWRLTGSTINGTAPLTWGAGTIGSTTTNRFLFPGYDDDLAQVDSIKWTIPRNGTLSRLYARHNKVGAPATLLTYTLLVNGVATALAASLAANAAVASNIATSVVVSAGDTVELRCSKAANLVGAQPEDVAISMDYAS